MDHKEGKNIFCCEGCKAIFKLLGAMLDVKNRKPDPKAEQVRHQ
jgi:hypothetical protein